MQSKARTVEQYFEELPEERKAPMLKLRQTILTNMDQNFEECMNYGMVGYVVPHDKYPAGYHCNTELPLPFVNIASQKNFVALYHMGIYANPELMEWFVGEYPKFVKTKLDMGKSCIRFKRMDQIPFELIGELMQKMTAEEWIACYEVNLKQK
ncbi:DUF1801 domain-containing protein [Putridiphycobacter roseus]|uniref:DUF1801 domain-containing protein n=1 Tax=Putridiphycobacter roseus TaxID=2219161 RepID=A0A2W1NQI1_9FLAO|nr:DUF1801 domain-containing protein [Putridiphycobacter roseus]PZE17902.1 DUF1801 domain-containing protein [Putridiphycobacter roseus]